MLAVHPVWSARSCDDCRTFAYNPDGTQLLSRSPDPSERVPVRLPLKVVPPCAVCPKIPKGVEPHWTNAVEMTERNWDTLWHYRQCKATGRFPDDDLVAFHAAIIGTADAALADERQWRYLLTVGAMKGGGK